MIHHPTPSPATNTTAPAIPLLLVDNEVRNLDVLESVLAAPGYQLTRAYTAQEALLALLDGEFAAIVLDIRMPGTSGIELAHLIKQRKKTAHIPIIFLTAYHQEEKEILEGYEVGAVDFLTKPISPQILRSKVMVFAELFRKSRELVALNRAMEAEIVQRQKAEEALQRANQDLENRVAERVAAFTELMRQMEIQTRLFDTTLASITDLAYMFDLEGNWIYANRPLLDLWGKTLDQITGRSSLELGYPPELAERLRLQVKEVIATRKPVQGETYFTAANGVEDYHEYIFCPVFARDGTVNAVCGTTRLTTERKRTEAAAESQRRALQLIAEDAPLLRVLETLARLVESQSATKALASVLLTDDDATHVRLSAGPSLPDAFNEALIGMPIEQGAASFATAMRSSQPVYSTDLAEEPIRSQQGDLALALDLRGFWVIPILSSQDLVLGAFAVYLSAPRPPQDSELKALEIAVRTAAIAIERKRSDDALRESERRYSQLVGNLPAAVYTTDAKGCITLYNESAAALWGRRPEIGKEHWCGSSRMYHPDGTPLAKEACPAAVTLTSGQPVRGIEIIVERPDGQRRSVLPYPDIIRDQSGRIVGSVHMLLDITEAKRTEEASRRLAAIVESSANAIVSKDLNGIITSWNPGACQLFGYGADEVIGKPITFIIPPHLHGEEQEILRRIRSGEHVDYCETVRRCKDGRMVEIGLTVSPIRDANGKVIGASKIARDITKQKRAEHELELAHRELLAASRAKDDFLAALSHELRTPLSPVLLIASEAAEDPGLSPEMRARFLTIRNGVELEARLIDDLLDITRITRGKLALNLEIVDPHTLFREALLTVQSELNQKQISITMDLCAKGVAIKGDAVRLQQVFWNVLKNAAKFTPKGGRITVRTHTQNDPGQFVIAITDSGIGISENEIRHIFDAFKQGEHADTEKSHRFGGLGLGLAITRKLVDLHAGTIDASSEGRDRGATFTIALPLVSTLSLEPQVAGTQGGPHGSNFDRTTAPSLRVLLVEDHEPTRYALAQLLQRRHFLVTTAASITEARSLADQQPFDLLISDLGLPDGNGTDLMRELRAKHPGLLAIALTGYGLEEDVVRTRESGFSSHLVKPVRIQSLEAALAATLPRKSPDPK